MEIWELFSTLLGAGSLRLPVADRFGSQLAGPAHPGDRGLRVVAELLSHELGAPERTEYGHNPGDGLLNLPGAGLVTAQQHRHEQGVGPNSPGAGLVCRWLHREPPR